jgi:hypothetical protein
MAHAVAQKCYILNDSSDKNPTLVTHFSCYYLETDLFIFLKYEMYWTATFTILRPLDSTYKHATGSRWIFKCRYLYGSLFYCKTSLHKTTKCRLKFACYCAWSSTRDSCSYRFYSDNLQSRPCRCEGTCNWNKMKLQGRYSKVFILLVASTSRVLLCFTDNKLYLSSETFLELDKFQKFSKRSALYFHSFFMPQLQSDDTY